MELTVYEKEKQVGTLRIEPDGLFYAVSCELTQGGGGVRRVFAGSGWKSVYLGIPDASGRLRTRLPKNRLPDGAAFAVAADIPRGQWLPWRGEADGVPIAEGYLRPTEDGIALLLPPQEAVKLPAWAQFMRKETAFGRDLMLVSLLPDGSLPEITKDTERGEEKDEEITCDTADDRVPADGIPRDGVGDEGRETDRADL